MDRVAIVYQKDASAARDGEARLWQGIPSYEAQLEMQQIVAPLLEEPGLSRLEVRAMHDGRELVMRFSWADPTQDSLSAVGKFSDALAIELPASSIGELPEFTMGSPDHAVIIHQWKAVWQEAEAGHLSGIRSFYPNTWSDGYLAEFARTDQRAAMERTFATSQAAENPLAHAGRAVRDLRAEGFGALEIDAKQTSQGRGVWRKGRWVVTMIRPLSREEGALVPGTHTYAAFALWDGSHGEVGSRKMITAWVPVEVEAAP